VIVDNSSDEGDISVPSSSTVLIGVEVEVEVEVDVGGQEDVAVGGRGDGLALPMSSLDRLEAEVSRGFC